MSATADAIARRRIRAIANERYRAMCAADGPRERAEIDRRHRWKAYRYLHKRGYDLDANAPLVTSELGEGPT